MLFELGNFFRILAISVNRDLKVPFKRNYDFDRNSWGKNEKNVHHKRMSKMILYNIEISCTPASSSSGTD